MPQHDMNIANQGFPAFRADLNNALGALVSNSSGATAPSTTFAHQLWVDTSANPSILKIRNADNDAFIPICSIDQTNDKITVLNATQIKVGSVTYTLPTADGTSGQVIETNGSGTLSFATPASVSDKIEEGDSKVEVTDAGTGKVEITVDNVELADFTTGAIVFNETGLNQDFRVEGDAEANLLFVDASTDRVGIGTNSPGSKLHVVSTSGENKIISEATAASQQASLSLIVQAATPGQTVIYMGKTGATTNGQLGYDPNTNNMTMFTNNAERVRIDSSGNLLVGTTTGTTAQLRVNTSQTSCSIMQNSNASPNGLQVAYSNVLNSVGNEFLFCSETTNTRMTVRSNGGIANFSANNVNLSDRREKTNFAPAKSYLETICAIPVQTFNYIDQNHEDDPGLTLGVVAQDVQEVAPELVMESNWGSKEEPKMRLSIYQTDLQYALMKCIQEQQTLITALTARVAALESN